MTNSDAIVKKLENYMTCAAEAWEAGEMTRAEKDVLDELAAEVGVAGPGQLLDSVWKGQG